MNRVISENLAGISPDTLPPRRSDRTRILFITTGLLGFTTFSRALEAYTASRDDVDAVHILFKPTRLVRWGSQRVPLSRGYDLVWHRYNIFAGIQLRRWFAGPLPLDRFDAVHITTQGIAHGIDRACRRAGIPYAVHLDATGIGEAREFPRRPGTMWAFIRSERKIFARAALLTGMTQWACDSLLNDYGIPPGRVALVRCPIDTADAGSPADRAPGGPFRIVFVGNDWARKGGPRLLRWHQERWKDRAELHIFSVHAPKDLSLPNVTVHGSVPRARLLGEILPGMHVSVLPTREDTMVHALLEAAAAGVPGVASRLAGIPEIVLHEKSGLLCKADDDAAFIAAVERLMNDETLRLRLLDTGRRHARENFRAEDWFKVLIDRVIGMAGRAPAPSRAPSADA